MDILISQEFAAYILVSWNPPSYFIGKEVFRVWYGIFMLLKLPIVFRYLTLFAEKLRPIRSHTIDYEIELPSTSS